MNKKEKKVEDIEDILLSTSWEQIQEVNKSNETEQDKGTIISFLTQKSDELAKEAVARKKKRENEKIEFIGGMSVSPNDIKRLTNLSASEYEPLFPNQVGFFRQMYRLLGWTDLDPNSYFKPKIVGYYLLMIIYKRFNKEVIQELRASAIPGGIRLFKLFQFLNDEGKMNVIKYRDEAIALMEDCDTWSEFRNKFATLYIQPFYSQQKLL